MKRISRLTILLFLMLAALIGATACDDIVSIGFDKGNEPQTVYVLGQELDLSKGTLTVRTKGGKEELALDAEGVTIEGYDKDTLGKQELKVSYNGHETSYTVNVVERIAVEGAKAEYFVGESPDLTRGRVRVTKNDGTSIVVPFTDSRVSLLNFDSATAGKKSVNVSYHEGSASYTGAFEVEICAIESIQLTPPNKIAYKSHETELNLAGGYLTLIGKGGNLKTYVTLTKDLVSGYDPAQAGVANRTEPLRQTITVVYAGMTKEFTVSVQFSDISLISLRVSELSGLNWSRNNPPSVSEEQGANALEAMQCYFGLSEQDKERFTSEELLAIARPAAFYGLTLWQTESEKFHTIGFTNGGLYFTGGGYEETKAEYALLEKEDAPIRTIAGTLNGICDLFGEERLYGDRTIAAYLDTVYDGDGFEQVLARMEVMFSLHESLLEVPDDGNWTAESLARYEQQLTSAASILSLSPFHSFADRTIYGIVSSWREHDDLFEMLYAYYYAQDNQAVIDALKTKRLPAELEALYDALLSAMQEMSSLAGGTSTDASLYMMYVHNAQACMHALSETENEMYATFYRELTFPNVLYNSYGYSLEVSFSQIYAFLLTGSSSLPGYYYINYIYPGDSDYDGMWREYTDFLNRVFTEEDFRGSESYGEAVEHLFRRFVELSPARQYGFIEAVNFLYGEGEPPLAFDTSEGAYSYFIYFIYDYYDSIFRSNNQLRVLQNLLLAIERVARQTVEEDMDALLDAFAADMATVERLYAGLSNTDRATVDAHLGFAYEKYVALAQRYASGTSAQLPQEWRTVFDDLTSALEEVNRLMGYYSVYEEGLTAVLASFEKAQSLSRRILEEAPPEVLQVFQYDYYDDYENTLDVFYYWMRYYYMGIVGSDSVTLSGSLFAQEYTDGLRDFLRTHADLLLSLFEEVSLTAEDITSALAANLALSAEERAALADIDNCFYEAIDAYLSQNMSPNAYAAAQALLRAEITYLYCILAPGQADLISALREALDEALSAHANLSATDLASFNRFLSEMYKAEAEEIKAYLDALNVQG